MGIPRACIKLLMREGNRKKLCGNILTVGKQDVYGASGDLQKWAEEMDFPLKPGVQMSISDNNKESYLKNYITDNALFRSLGFDNIDSIDVSEYEKCTLVHDLNNDVPHKLHGKYDLLYDGGASEHIFNFPKVLENYNKMLKVGGRIIHALPSSNCVDHGFYMFSPTALYDYYSANNWEIIDLFFIKYSSTSASRLWSIYEYEPGCLRSLSMGGLNNGIYATFFVAQKNDDSTFNAPVQQGIYLKEWDNASKMELKTSTFHGNTWLRKIANWLPKDLKCILMPIYYKIPLKFSLKLIARY